MQITQPVLPTHINKTFHTNLLCFIDIPCNCWMFVSIVIVVIVYIYRWLYYIIYTLLKIQLLWCVVVNCFQKWPHCKVVIFIFNMPSYTNLQKIETVTAYKKRTYSLLAFLAHLSTKCSRWAFVMAHCPSSIVRACVRASVNNFFKQHLLWNHLMDFNQTSQEWSLGGPLSKLFKPFQLVA